MNRSSNGICPMARPRRKSDVISCQRNETRLVAFAKRRRFAAKSFPASTATTESTFSRRAESRSRLRVIEPEYFSATPLGSAFENDRLEIAAPLVQTHRPLGVERISANACIFLISKSPPASAQFSWRASIFMPTPHFGLLLRGADTEMEARRLLESHRNKDSRLMALPRMLENSGLIVAKGSPRNQETRFAPLRSAARSVTSNRSPL